MTNLNNYLAHKEKIRLRFGLLLVIIGLLWFGKTIGWIASEIFGPLLMLTLGIWFILSYILNNILNKYNNWISSLELKQGDFDGI